MPNEDWFLFCLGCLVVLAATKSIPLCEAFERHGPINWLWLKATGNSESLILKFEYLTLWPYNYLLFH